MLNFECDYLEGAHEKVLAHLLETNKEKQPGYGGDRFTAAAREKIRQACACPQAEVFFLSGGTQTNKTAISSMLKPYQGVVAARTGHISLHEAGAIESTGHKVLELEQKEGKLSASVLKAYLKNFYGDPTREHMTFPGMVYLSHPTEYGTLYTKAELAGLSAVCTQYGIPLYMDGARLGYALAADTDVTLPDVANYCDVFYIGGTKVGALCGEALVFTKKNLPEHFENLLKRNGALMAKGRLIGAQFDALFTGELYWEISKHAVEMAELLRTGLRERGYRFYLETPTNQIFVILENEQMKKLGEKVKFSYWEPADDSHSVVRFATSWATSREEVEELLQNMNIC